MNDAIYEAFCQAIRMSETRSNPEGAPPTLREALHFVAGQLSITYAPGVMVIRRLMEVTQQ